MNRLNETYQKIVVPKLIEEYSLGSIMASPQILKVVINTGIKEGPSDAQALEKTKAWMGAITGQTPAVRKAKKSIATFKIREGDPIGLSVTLRGKRMWEFLDKMISIVLPRLRDFRGISTKSFDGKGNYTIGFSEQIVFPEVDYAKIDKVRGLEVSIVTNAGDDKKAKRTLELLGFPFKKDDKD